MNRVSYKAEFKAEAVKQAIERAHGVVEVSNRLGVSDKNRYLWVRQAKERQGAGSGEAASLKSEIARLKPEHLDFWVSGYDTGGTVTGVARVLHKERPKTRIVLSEPELAPLLRSSAASTTRQSQATPPLLRTRSEAGSQTSSLMTCRKPLKSITTTSLFLCLVRMGSSDQSGWHWSIPFPDQ